jgi:FkbM family methyltransferase
MIIVKLKNFLARNRVLRNIFYPIFAHFDFEFAMKHPTSGRPLYLRTWVHKAYWYYGSSREEQETELIASLISKNWDILEVGAHIGFLTQIFESLSAEGKIVVIEPTPSSIRLLEKNIRPSTVLVKAAASDEVGRKTLFVEQHGGFCNSLDPKFVQQADQKQELQVPHTTIDHVCDAEEIRPKFIKIDVEGWELNVLRGAEIALGYAQCVMVEVFRDVGEVYSFLIERGFKPYDSRRRPIYMDRLKEGNIFFIKQCLDPMMRGSENLVD